MDVATVVELISLARTLSAIQIEGVDDEIGFSNADKYVGAFLAAAVETDPTDEETLRALAALVCKYRRQSEGMVGAEMHARFKQIAGDRKIDMADRERARRTILTNPNVHPTFGPQVIFQWNGFSYDYAEAVKRYRGKAYKEEGAWKWAVPAENAADCAHALEALGCQILGSYDVPENIVATLPKKTNRDLIHVELQGKSLFLNWVMGHHVTWNTVAKALPTRRFDWDIKAWVVPLADLAVAEAAFRDAGADTSEFKKYESAAPTLAQIKSDEPDYLTRIPQATLDKMFPYQVDGVKWLLRPLNQIRQALNSQEPKGAILGDDMGLGKTFQAIVAAQALAEEGERILVVCPASLKMNWKREIIKWAGAQDICIGEGSIIAPARWMIVNYDVLPKVYDRLESIGYAVMLCDEAHYAKNRESNRSKMIVGGLVPIPKTPTPRDERKKERRRIDGLAALATRRVFMLTGTPVTNRPKDLFNLLKAVKHPLGRNWMQFGQRYCNPQFNGFGTTYNGASNLDDLRSRVLPVFLQRKKDDHLNLPPKIRAWTPVEVDLEEYRRVMAEYDARRAAGELSKTEHHLALLTEARVCAATAKAPRTIELIENAIEQGEKVLVFTLNTKVLNKIMAHFGDIAVKIDGSCSKTQRTDAEDRFMKDDSVRVIVGNLIAMGTGLNLTAGTQVIVNDLDWVPANHLQAEDRAYRIGQEKMVNVTYVLAAGTFDEELAVLLEEKFGMVSAFEDYDTGPLFNLLIDRLATNAPKNEGVKALVAAKATRRKSLAVA